MSVSAIAAEGPSFVQAVLLALVQGITEFLPISSSAHLILASWALGWPDQGLAFDMATHVGSWLALVWCYRADLSAELSRWRRGDSNLLLPLALGTVPVLIGGLLMQDWVGGRGRSPSLIAATTIGFGLLLWVADRRVARSGGVPAAARWRWRPAAGYEDLGSRDSGPSRAGTELAPLMVFGLVGLAQAIALVPGVSRSGITITAALLIGLSRPAAARVSFLLAIPLGAIVGAKDLWDLVAAPQTADWSLLLAGMVVSGLTAWVVIRVFLAWIEARSLLPFVLYRLALGAAILALVLV